MIPCTLLLWGWCCVLIGQYWPRTQARNRSTSQEFSRCIFSCFAIAIFPPNVAKRFFYALLFCCLRWLATEYIHSIMNTTKQFTKMDTIVRKTFSIWIKHFFRSHVSLWLHRDNAEVLPRGKSTFPTIVLYFTYNSPCRQSYIFL